MKSTDVSRKRKTLSGPIKRNSQSVLVGKRLKIPGSVFYVEDQTYYATVLQQPKKKKNVAYVKFDGDQAKYWFPVVDVEKWAQSYEESLNTDAVEPPAKRSSKSTKTTTDTKSIDKAAGQDTAARVQHKTTSTAKGQAAERKAVISNDSKEEHQRVRPATHSSKAIKEATNGSSSWQSKKAEAKGEQNTSKTGQQHRSTTISTSRSGELRGKPKEDLVRPSKPSQPAEKQNLTKSTELLLPQKVNRPAEPVTPSQVQVVMVQIWGVLLFGAVLYSLLKHVPAVQPLKTDQTQTVSTAKHAEAATGVTDQQKGSPSKHSHQHLPLAKKLVQF